MSKVRMSKVRMSKVRMSKVRMSKVRMSKVRMSKVRMSKVRMSKVRMSKVRMSKVRMSKVRMSKVRMSKVRMSKVRMSKVRMSKVRMSKVRMSKVRMSKVRMSKVRMSKVRMSKVRMSKVRMSKVRMSKVRMSKVRMSKVRMSKVRMSKVRMSKVRMSKVRMSKVRMSKVRMSKVRMSKVRMSKVRMSKVRMSKVRMSKVRMSKVRMSKVRMSKVGMSKEHRASPQVQAGLLADPGGFPLEVHLFEGNKAETTTFIPVLSPFAQRHGVRDMGVVADAGMLSAANLNALEDAGFGFIVGSRITRAPYDLAGHFQRHGNYFTDGQVLESARQMAMGQANRVRRVVYQWKFKREQHGNKTINAMIERAEKIADGRAPLKKARFLKVTDATTEPGQVTIDRARQLAGLKGYVTNLPASKMAGAAVIAAHHDLLRVEQSFRMTKGDLRARPVFHSSASTRASSSGSRSSSAGSRPSHGDGRSPIVRNTMASITSSPRGRGHPLPASDHAPGGFFRTK